MRRRTAGILVAAALCGSCSAPPSREADLRARPPLFTEITGQLGLASLSGSWPDGTYFMPEIMGPGVAVLDYDGDGDLDLLVPGVPPPGDPQSAAPKRLWRQDSDGRFTDVTEAAGLGHGGFGSGVAVGDTDNDGDVDLYFTNYGPDQFFVNQGDGTFTEATAAAGFRGDRWSASATFCDYDRDGDLDLYVTHYLAYDSKTRCTDDVGRPDYCAPWTFRGVSDALYRNEGGNRFEDVTEAAGIRLPEHGVRARGLGVVCADLTGDGLADFYVANDREANQLWVQQPDGTFADAGILRGVAVNRFGVAESSMGIAIGDATGDGVLDLFTTNLASENNTLHVGDAMGLFTDRTGEAGMMASDLQLTGFGTGFSDFDHDGDLDIAVVNGRVARGPALLPGGFWDQYAQRNLLFRNDGTGRFEDVTASAGAFGAVPAVSRGLAFGDLDGDGDLDMVVSRHDNSLAVHRNDAPGPGTHWLLVRAVTGRRDALGAELRLSAGGRTQLRLVLAGYSYLSSNDPRAHFGLADADRVDSLEVRWPSGRRERFSVEGVDRAITVVEGSGSPP